MSSPKLGLLGGLSYISTIEYYQKVNQYCRENRSSRSTVDMVLRSVDEGQFETLQIKDPTENLCKELILEAFKDLKNAGCTQYAICCNGIHRFEKEINQSGIQIIHIVDSVINYCKSNNISKVSIIGIMRTMNGDFYTSRLSKAGIEMISPTEDEKLFVDRKIFEEMVLGQFHNKTKEEFIRICQNLRDAGAEAVVLGCTEIPILLKNVEIEGLKLISTTDTHCRLIADTLYPKN